MNRMTREEIYKLKKEICYYLNKEENDYLTDRQLNQLMNEKGFKTSFDVIRVHRQNLNIPASMHSGITRRYLRRRLNRLIYRVDGKHIKERK